MIFSRRSVAGFSWHFDQDLPRLESIKRQEALLLTLNPIGQNHSGKNLNISSIHLNLYCLVRLQPSTILGGVLLGSGRHKLHWLGPNHSQVSHDESFESYRSISFQTKQEVYRDLRNLALLGLHVYSPIPTSHHSQWHDLCRGKFLVVKIPSTHIFIETAEVTAKKTPFSVCVVLKFVSLWLQRWDEQEMSELSSPEARWCGRAHCCALFLCFIWVVKYRWCGWWWLSRSQVVRESTLLCNISLLSGWWHIDAVDDVGSP